MPISSHVHHKWMNSPHFHSPKTPMLGGFNFWLNAFQSPPPSSHSATGTHARGRRSHRFGTGDMERIWSEFRLRYIEIASNCHIDAGQSWNSLFCFSGTLGFMLMTSPFAGPFLWNWWIFPNDSLVASCHNPEWSLISLVYSGEGTILVALHLFLGPGLNWPLLKGRKNRTIPWVANLGLDSSGSKLSP